MLLEMEATNCRVCGGYTSVTEIDLLMKMKPNVLCCCDGFPQLHESNAANIGYVYCPYTQNYIYDAEFDHIVNHYLDFDVYQ